MGIFESRKVTEIAAFYFRQHLFDVSGRERVFHSFAEDFQLSFRIARRPLGACLAQRASGPFTYGELLAPGHALDLSHFGIREQHLQPLTHRVSITCSMYE